MHRRSVLKGMLAGGVLAAVGLPRWSEASSSFTFKPAALVLTGTGYDAAFAGGAQAAARASGGNALPMMQLARGIVPDVGATRSLFEQSKGRRIVGLMADGAYVVFTELARDAGARLICVGQHSVGADGSWSRHALQSVPGFHGVAEPMVAGLMRTGRSFAVTEVPLGAPSRPLTGGDWSALGFNSYRVGEHEPFWLHLSGVPLGAGCAALDVSAAQAEPLRCWRAYEPKAADVGGGWAVMLGHELARLSLAVERNRAPCIAQAFFHRQVALLESRSTESLVSFVMEI